MIRRSHLLHRRHRRHRRQTPIHFTTIAATPPVKQRLPIFPSTSKYSRWTASIRSFQFFRTDLRYIGADTEESEPHKFSFLYPSAFAAPFASESPGSKLKN